MAATSVQRFYRFHAWVYDFTRWTILHGRRRAVEQLALAPGDRVLEVGCGTGLNFSLVMDKLDPQRGRLTGLDFSSDMLRVAQRRTAARGWTTVDLLEADATTLNLDRRFDAILFAYSLTMIPDWRRALERAVAHLAPGGRLVVLDFCHFRGWGPLSPLMRGWLRANHVDTLQPYSDVMRELLPSTRVGYWLGGYNFTAVGQRGANG